MDGESGEQVEEEKEKTTRLIVKIKHQKSSCDWICIDK